MTATEKQNIYTLLKCAASATLGYTSPSFKDEISFTDDKMTNSRFTLEDIAKNISECKRCNLAQTRLSTVPGEGVSNPFVLVIGEGPGEEEDKTGRPFVGKAGQLLDKMLSAIQLSRKANCFIANIVKCRPPKNRTPFPEEAESCLNFLKAQIILLKPKMLLLLGRTAVQNVLKTDEGIKSLRGKLLTYNQIPLVATYHPSALLRDEALKRPAWEDLKLFRAKLFEICPDYAQSFENLNKIGQN